MYFKSFNLLLVWSTKYHSVCQIWQLFVHSKCDKSHYIWEDCIEISLVAYNATTDWLHCMQCYSYRHCASIYILCSLPASLSRQHGSRPVGSPARCLVTQTARYLSACPLVFLVSTCLLLATYTPTAQCSTHPFLYPLAHLLSRSRAVTLVHLSSDSFIRKFFQKAIISATKSVFQPLINKLIQPLTCLLRYSSTSSLATFSPRL